MAKLTAKATSAVEYLPSKRDLKSLAEAARRCQACDLYRNATQTVFGEGRRGAKVFFIGEQPGDKEDQLGEPFVGPAGMLFDACMEEAGIDRKAAYVTNAVKHFKWEPRGKLRIHKKPDTNELTACRPWLDAEIEAVGPELIVCLGATAAQDLLGNKFRVTKQRGVVMEAPGYPPGFPPIMATVHPSSILRAPDAEARRRERMLFVEDLRKIAALIS